MESVTAQSKLEASRMKKARHAALVLSQRPKDSWRERSLSKVLAQSLSQAEEAEV